jgi:hypothetical protein
MLSGKASVSGAGSVAASRAAGSSIEYRNASSIEYQLDSPEDGRAPGKRNWDRDREKERESARAHESERQRGGAREKYYPPPLEYAEEDQGGSGEDEARQLDQFEDQRRRQASAREHRMGDWEGSTGGGEFFPPGSPWDQVCIDGRVWCVCGQGGKGAGSGWWNVSVCWCEYV